MSPTKEQIEKKIATAKEARDKMLANLNAQFGYIQALEEQLKELDAPEPSGTPSSP